MFTLNKLKRKLTLGFGEVRQGREVYPDPSNDGEGSPWPLTELIYLAKIFSKVTDRPFISDEISTPRDAPIVEILENKYGCVSEEAYYSSLSEQTKRELEARARILAQRPENQTNRDDRLKREFERKLVATHEGFLVIVLAGEGHQSSILDALKYKGYTPRIISSTMILNNSSKSFPTIEMNYLRHQTTEARKTREAGNFVLNPGSLTELIEGFNLKTKPRAAAILIGDQHGLDYEFNLPSAEELHRAGIKSVLFYGEHGDQNHFSTVDSLTSANLGKTAWSGYRRVGQHLKDYQESGVNIDIIGFEAGPDIDTTLL